MFDEAKSEVAQHVCFVLIPNFSMMAFTSAVEPLRAANRLSGSALYSWQLVSVDGEPVTASNGVRVQPDGDINSARDRAVIVVCAGLGVERFDDARLNRWLRGKASSNAALGAICTGSWVLARAGVLQGYHCTIHWENVEGFVEEFPHLHLTATLFEIDRHRFTCSGGTAPLDMMLHAIRQRHGDALAIRVAEQMLHSIPRQPLDPQRLSLRHRTGLSHPKLLAVIAQMEAFLENPVTLDELGIEVSLSTRQLERLFRNQIGVTPKHYYLQLRLKRAQFLLHQTSLPILQVAVACGFTTGSHFAKTYRTMFGESPRVARASLRLVA